jgi:prepilin-type N-terminal cleavage/methylation domain-containing protein
VTRDSQQAGFTIIEAVIALAVLGIVLAAIAPIFISNLRDNNRSEKRSEAIAVARQVFEGLRYKDPATLPTSGTTTENVVMGGQTFQVDTTMCSLSTYCTTGSRHITVTVKQGGTTQFSADTVFTQLFFQQNR